MIHWSFQLLALLSTTSANTDMREKVAYSLADHFESGLSSASLLSGLNTRTEQRKLKEQARNIH